MKSKYLILTLIPLLTACSQSDTVETSAGNTPLKVELSAQTRAAITATTLPDGSAYRIFVTNAEGDSLAERAVSYAQGTSTLSQPYMLNSEVRHIYAAYTGTNYSLGFPDMFISSSTQTDYLFGAARTSDGDIADINEDNYVAHIRLDHAMAQIRFRVTRSEDNDEACFVGDVFMEGIQTQGYLNIVSGKLDLLDNIGTVYTKNAFYASPTSSTDIDMLVVPQYRDFLYVHFNIDGQDRLVLIPEITLEAGNVYVYTVLIQNRGRLEVSEVEILPREEGEGGSYVIPYAQ